MDEVRLSPSNRRAVTFAISGSDAEGIAFRKRSEFVFERPLSATSIRNTLEPAYGLILRERRRYFRCPVAIPVTIRRESMQEVRCNSVNISEGGMPLSTFVPLIPGENVRVQLCPITKYRSWQNQRSAGRKRAILEFASYLFRTSTSPNYRSGCHEN